MIKRLICWLWGHKIYGWSRIGGNGFYNDYERLWYKTCPRCGKDLR